MKPTEWNETCSLAPANHETGPDQPSETDLLRARVAQLEYRLGVANDTLKCCTDDLGDAICGKALEGRCLKSLYGKCLLTRNLMHTTLADSSTEWLERVKREAAVEALEKVGCLCGDPADRAHETYCPLAHAAAIREGKG